MVSRDQASAFCSNSKVGDASHSSTSGSRHSSRNLQPFIVKTFFSSCSCCLMLLLVAAWFPPISAGGNFNATTIFDCSPDIGNMICLGAAHSYTGNYFKASFSGVQNGSLSFIPEPDPTQESVIGTCGIAYYNEPIRLLDPSTNQSASFNTSFTISVVEGTTQGDGMAFVMSADNATLGSIGPYFGIFNPVGMTTFKSIAVEFDGVQNPGFPTYDINDNHVGFDFSNIAFAHDDVANLSNVQVILWNVTIYGWVEYSNANQQLELRVSLNNSRPISPLLTSTVDLFDVVEEYMWVGFSAGSSPKTGLQPYYYVGNWSFESYGIPPTSSGNGSFESHGISPTSSGNWSFESNGIPPTSSGRATRDEIAVGLIVGISVGGLALFVACIFIVVFGKRRGCSCCPLGWTELGEDDEMVQFGGTPAKFRYRELSVATGDFNKESKLGQGGFGNVYRGVLPSSGVPVAVKKINGDSPQGEKEFMAEVSIINQLRHRNLIQLLGWCKNTAKESYLLVYELMPNGSLDKALFRTPERETVCLSWSQRFHIVTGTAAALDYLHEGWKKQVLHRDIKSSNIMLDEEWNPKLADFGLACFVDHKRTAATSWMGGTYGYIAPEAASAGRFTVKSDVFAFGAVALEVACGRPALIDSLPSEEMVLVDWVWHCLSKGDLLSAVDKRLRDYDTHWMEVLLIVGLLCSHPNPQVRPSMRQVLQILAGDAEVPSISAVKPVLVFSSDPLAMTMDDLNLEPKVQTSHRHRSSRSGSVSSLWTMASLSTAGSPGKTPPRSRSSSLSSAWTTLFSDSTGVSTLRPSCISKSNSSLSNSGALDILRTEDTVSSN